MVRDLLDYLNAGVEDRVEQIRQVLHGAGGQVVGHEHVPVALAEPGERTIGPPLRLVGVADVDVPYDDGVAALDDEVEGGWAQQMRADLAAAVRPEQLVGMAQAAECLLGQRDLADLDSRVVALPERRSVGHGVVPQPVALGEHAFGECAHSRLGQMAARREERGVQIALPEQVPDPFGHTRGRAMVEGQGELLVSHLSTSSWRSAFRTRRSRPSCQDEKGELENRISILSATSYKIIESYHATRLGSAAGMRDYSAPVFVLVGAVDLVVTVGRVPA